MRGVSGLCPAGYIWNGEFCEPELEFQPTRGSAMAHRMGMRPARRNPGHPSGTGALAAVNPGGCGCGGHARMNGSDITPLATLGVIAGFGALAYVMFNKNK